jgi:hypothetical protein
MLIDAPGVEETKAKPGDTTVTLTEDNVGEVFDLINRLNR